MDLNEMVSFTPMTNGTGVKRSHPQSCSEEGRGEAFPDADRSSSDEETRNELNNKHKAPRMMQELDQSYATLFQGLDSPNPEGIWKQDAMGAAVNRGFCTSPLHATTTERRNEQADGAFPPMTPREGQPTNGMLPRTAFIHSQGQPWTFSPEVDENGMRRNDYPEAAFPPMMQRESQPMNRILPRPQAFTDAQGRPWTYSPGILDENGYPTNLPSAGMPTHQPQVLPTNNLQQPDLCSTYAYYPYPNGAYAPPPPIVGYVYDPKPPPLHNPYALPAAAAVAHPIYPMDGPVYQQQQFPPAPYAPFVHSGVTAEAPVFQRENSNGSSHHSGSADSSSQEHQDGKARQSMGTHHAPVLMHSDRDDDILSDYQIFLRKQIEFFEADQVEVKTATPGRKVPVVLGQVGIRCIHCADVPIQQRAAATAYFPSRLKGLYQAAQNIGTTHFRKSCPNIPAEQQELSKTAFQVNGKRATAGHGGKKYWADSAASLGVIETETGLRFSTTS
jgi:hypothetical protein